MVTNKQTAIHELHREELRRLRELFAVSYRFANACDKDKIARDEACHAIMAAATKGKKIVADLCGET